MIVLPSGTSWSIFCSVLLYAVWYVEFSDPTPHPRPIFSRMVNVEYVEKLPQFLPGFPTILYVDKDERDPQLSLAFPIRLNVELIE